MQNIIEEYNNNILDVEEMSFYGNFELASTLLQDWIKKAEKANAPKTINDLRACADALARVGIYVSQMQARQREFNIQLGRFRRAKLEADAQAAAAKQELEDYKIEL